MSGAAALDLAPDLAPDEPHFFTAALDALPVCIAACTCGDRWHVMWAGLKALGMLRHVHAQREFLRTQLAPLARPGLRVLVAGAADAGSLETLVHALGEHGHAADFTVADLCPAPLALVQAHARREGLRVECRLAGIESDAALRCSGGPWDLVFIHYTLAFLDAPARAQFMRRLHGTLAEQGLVVNAVRDREPAANPGGASAPWAASVASQLQTRFAAHPLLLAELVQHLDAYAEQRRQREASMARHAALVGEFVAAGFECLSEHRDPGQPAISTRVGGAGAITPWISFLRTAR